MICNRKILTDSPRGSVDVDKFDKIRLHPHIHIATFT